MFSALCSIGILGFWEFLKSAVFVVRIYITEVVYFPNLLQVKKKKNT